MCCKFCLSVFFISLKTEKALFAVFIIVKLDFCLENLFANTEKVSKDDIKVLLSETSFFCNGVYLCCTCCTMTSLRGEHPWFEVLFESRNNMIMHSVRCHRRPFFVRGSELYQTVTNLNHTLTPT